MFPGRRTRCVDKTHPSQSSFLRTRVSEKISGRSPEPRKGRARPRSSTSWSSVSRVRSSAGWRASSRGRSGSAPFAKLTASSGADGSGCVPLSPCPSTRATHSCSPRWKTTRVAGGASGAVPAAASSATVAAGGSGSTASALGTSLVGGGLAWPPFVDLGLRAGGRRGRTPPRPLVETFANGSGALPVFVVRGRLTHRRERSRDSEPRNLCGHGPRFKVSEWDTTGRGSVTSTSHRAGTRMPACHPRPPARARAGKAEESRRPAPRRASVPGLPSKAACYLRGPPGSPC